MSVDIELVVLTLAFSIWELNIYIQFIIRVQQFFWFKELIFCSLIEIIFAWNSPIFVCCSLALPMWFHVITTWLVISSLSDRLCTLLLLKITEYRLITNSVHPSSFNLEIFSSHFNTTISVTWVIYLIRVALILSPHLMLILIHSITLWWILTSVDSFWLMFGASHIYKAK